EARNLLAALEGRRVDPAEAGVGVAEGVHAAPVVVDPVALDVRGRLDVDGLGTGRHLGAGVTEHQALGVAEAVHLAVVAKHPVARLAGNRGAVAGAGRPGLGRLRRGPDHGAGGVGGVGDGPDPVVLAVGDPEAAVSGVERDVVQEVELGLQCGAVLALDRALTTALGAVDAVTGDRVDRGAAGGVEVDPANPGARLLGDEQVTHVVAGDAAGPVEVSIGRQATVTAVVADHRRGL